MPVLIMALILGLSMLHYHFHCPYFRTGGDKYSVEVPSGKNAVVIDIEHQEEEGESPVKQVALHTKVEADVSSEKNETHSQVGG